MGTNYSRGAGCHDCLLLGMCLLGSVGEFHDNNTATGMVYVFIVTDKAKVRSELSVPRTRVARSRC